MKHRFSLALALIGACAAMPAAHAGSQCTPHSVSVSGSGSASAAPGTYVFHVAVTRRGTDIPAANAAVDTRVEAAVSAARKAGIAKADIQSTQVTINPVYDSQAKPDTPQTYEVRRSITLTLRTPSAYAGLMEGLIGAGVDRIDNIEMRPDDPQALSDKALSAAIADARRKAQLIAQKLGVGLGPAIEVQESGQGPRPLIMGAMQARSGDGGAYEPGRITANADVSARFELAPSGCPAH